MDISPAVRTPNRGDPITAAWAEQVAAAVNSSAFAPVGVGAVQTPFGTAEFRPVVRETEESELPMPFDAILYGADSTELYVALPSDVADYVWLGPDPVEPDAEQALGTEDSAWVSLGAIARGSPRFVYLGFAGTQDEETGEVTVDGWRVYLASSANYRPSWVAPFTPLVLLAAYRVPADGAGESSAPNLRDGLVQYHHGTILAPFVQPEPEDEPEENTPECGHPLNGDGGDEDNPLDGEDRGGGNPLDREGDGGYTPKCLDDNPANNDN